MSGNEYKAEILWHEAPDEGDITWSLTGECRVRVVRIDDYDEPTMVEFYVPVNGDPAELEKHVDPALRSHGWERTGDINSWWSKSRDDEIDGSPAEGTFSVRPLASRQES